MKKIVLLCTLANLLILGIPCSYSQNVGINNSGATPNSSALLDIDAAGMSPKGILIPRIALTSATDAATIATPETSLLVYNPGTGGLSPAGYYYNQGTSGSPNWVPFLTNNVNTPSAWSLTGNTGTTGGPNFIGTTDNISLRFKTNNTQKMIIDSLGNVGIGTTTPSSAAKLQINTTVDRTTTNIGNAFFVDNASFATGVGGILYLGGKFDAAGTSLREYGYVAGVKSNATDGNFDGDLVFGTRTNGASPNTERLRILANGNVGIGTTAPNTLLDVNGSVAHRSASLALSNGANTDIAITSSSFFRITGPTGAFSITGLTGGVDGRIVTLYNSTSQVLTIVNDATSTAANRIYTLTGSNIVSAANKSAIQLQYSSADSRWLVISSQNTLVNSGSGGPVDVQTFTSSGIWTKPPSGSMARIQCWGGGGGGGNNANNDGGGGGGYNESWTPLSSLGATETVTIAAGGASGNPGVTGGNTTFGAWLTAYGGSGANISFGSGGGGGGTTSAGGANGAPGTPLIYNGTGNEGTKGLGAVFHGGGGGSDGWGYASGGSIYGGGGGGGATPGKSIYGGNGGATNVAGTQPGGGGGTYKAGGAGKCVVTSW